MNNFPNELEETELYIASRAPNPFNKMIEMIANRVKGSDLLTIDDALYLLEELVGRVFETPTRRALRRHRIYVTKDGLLIHRFNPRN